MTSIISPSDLKSLQEKIALLEQQVIEQKTVIDNQERCISVQRQTLNDRRKEITDQQKEITDQKDTIKDRESLIYNKEVQLQKITAQLHDLQRMHFGSSSERYVSALDIAQMKFDFFNEAELLARLAEAAARRQTVVKPHARKGRKSKPLPDDLPVVEVRHELDSDTCDVCGGALKVIGRESSDQLALIPLMFYVIRHIRPKMGCPKKCGVNTPPMPEQPLPGTQASPVLLAWLIVSKYLDGMPLYRIEKIVKRCGIDLPRNKLARWLVDLGVKRLHVFYEYFQAQLNAYDITWADETGFQVLKEPKRAPQSKSWLWIRRGGPPEKPVVILDYTPSRSGDVAKSLLGGFTGYLVCDGYSGYFPLAKSGDVVLVNCNDHARRRFRKVVESIGKDHPVDETIAARALLWYQCLYDIEAEIKELSVKEKYTARQHKAVPLWQEFIAWASQIITDGVLHQATRDALKYLLNHQQGLKRYCEDGRLPISNIRAEHVAKTIAIPRKNFLFSDSKDGAKSSAILYSVIETARANGHDPHQYLSVILTELPAVQTNDQIEGLLPWNITPEQVSEKYPPTQRRSATMLKRKNNWKWDNRKIEPAAPPGSRYS